MENRDWTQLYRITKSSNLFLEPVSLEFLNQILIILIQLFIFSPKIIQSTYVRNLGFLRFKTLLRAIPRCIEQRAKGQLQPEEHAILSLVVDTIFRGHQVLNVPYHMSHILIA